MFNPPAVRWSVGRSRLHRRVVFAIAWVLLCLDLVCTSIPVQWQYAGPMWAVSAIALLAASYGLHKAPSGILCWTGSRWRWSAFPQNAPACVECVLEFPQWVLVRVSLEGRSATWLWLESGADAPQWSALRRALAFTHSDSGESKGLAPTK
jgi:hypothetical protein